MPNRLSYKSFCWNFGTTSFRTKYFNRTIELQLKLLSLFWETEVGVEAKWSCNEDLQIQYYDFLRKNEFVDGVAKNKAKDARQKTSGLVELGLINNERRLTSVGEKLLSISRNRDFSSDNFFMIPKDSYIYLKQLLKTSCKIESKSIRPFIVFLYVISKVNYLTLEEFEYLLPLCIDQVHTNNIIENIEKYRNGTCSLDDVIIQRLLSMDNYKEALELFLRENVTADLICEIGMNRKSRNYDKPYFPLYNALYEVYVKKDFTKLPNIYNLTRKLTSGMGVRWRNYLFNTLSRVQIKNNPRESINATLFDSVKSDEQFRRTFFTVMHLIKAKASLSDYLDLNRRYIRTTDIVLFNDGVVQLDIVPKHFFYKIMDELYKVAYENATGLFENFKLEEIAPCLKINETNVISSVNEEVGSNVTTIDEARNVIEDRRYKKLQILIDMKFSDEKILKLLSLFENREDDEIQEMVTSDADIPTIFEYVLGILWYKISNRTGKILDFMKLSLDADLLPKTHAAGGEADIVYEYEKTSFYPAHTVLLEATLADRNNQRRMEMEPVSRHLGQHLIENENGKSYCIFATNYLNINVISDFRGRKYNPYYDLHDESRYVTGMKIIPLQSSELKTIVQGQLRYQDLYGTFEKAFQSDLPPHKWYSEMVTQKLQS